VHHLPVQYRGQAGAADKQVAQTKVPVHDYGRSSAGRLATTRR
jgi:hypothetical protein